VARRAAREVQRVEESGVGVVGGDRRVTIVPATPRKGGLAPVGTPARARTPGREKTPGR